MLARVAATAQRSERAWCRIVAPNSCSSRRPSCSTHKGAAPLTGHTHTDLVLGHQRDAASSIQQQADAGSMLFDDAGVSAGEAAALRAEVEAYKVRAG